LKGVYAETVSEWSGNGWRERIEGSGVQIAIKPRVAKINDTEMKVRSKKKNYDKGKSA